MDIKEKYKRARARRKAGIRVVEEIVFWMDPPALLSIEPDGEELWVEDCSLYSDPPYVRPPLPPGREFIQVGFIRDMHQRVWQMTFSAEWPPGEDWRVRRLCESGKYEFRRPHKLRLPKRAFTVGGGGS